MLISHKTVAGWLFDEWGLPATLREAVTESERPEDEPVQCPVVRVVSSLNAPQESAEVIEETVGRIETVFVVPQDQALAILEAARIDGATLAQSLTWVVGVPWWKTTFHPSRSCIHIERRRATVVSVRLR